MDRMTAFMEARGPDGHGRWQSGDGRVILGHRRLAIIDIDSRSDQPLHSHDNRYSIVFNGEIYNYRELREYLKSSGSVLRTESDTEVLIELFRIRGKSMLSDLRGMFTFAIWDNLENRLFVARDPYGIKPLYYSLSNREFRFASQVKALVAGGITFSPDPAAIVGFHLFGSIPEPFTWVDSIRAFPAGHWMELSSEGVLAERTYCSIADLFSSSPGSEPAGNTSIDNLQDALINSVKAHLVSDLPIGLFLSAGIDSGALLGLTRQASTAEIVTLTLSFDEFRSTQDDEAIIAAQVARHYGAKHQTHRVGQAEFVATIPKFFDAMDQPTIDGINSYFVSKAANASGLRVAISGLGGDELFGGYPSFRNIPRDVSRIRQLGLGKNIAQFSQSPFPRKGLPSWFEPKIDTLLSYGSTFEGAYLARRCVFTPQELPGVMDRDLAIEGLARLEPLLLLSKQCGSSTRNSFQHVALLESSMYMRNQLLRDTDWASMAHSLEVRTPLVDSFLLRQCNTLLRTHGDSVSKLELALSPANPIPEAVIRRSKTGFSTPIAGWLQEAEVLGEWRNCPALSRKNTKWAKRWAYSVSRRFFGHI